MTHPLLFLGEVTIRYSVDESEELARVTQLYQNVGDNMTQETASETLTSTLQGFQLSADDAESIVDKFNEVAKYYWLNLWKRRGHYAL